MQYFKFLHYCYACDLGSNLQCLRGILLNVHGWFHNWSSVPVVWCFPWFTQLQMITLSFALILSWLVLFFVSIFMFPLLWYALTVPYTFKQKEQKYDQENSACKLHSGSKVIQCGQSKSCTVVLYSLLFYPEVGFEAKVWYEEVCLFRIIWHIA